MISIILIRSLLLGWLCSTICSPVLATRTEQTIFSPSPADHVQMRGKNAAVASESDACSRIGMALNEAGGNAADMMVGTVLCVGVVAMYHSGIGGGGFALVHLPNGTAIAVDFREAAPAGSKPDMWNANPWTQYLGGLSSGIPGELRGLEYVHSNFGKLPWSSVVAPAARLAVNGFRVNLDLERYMNITISRVGDFFTKYPEWAEDFAPNGTRLGLNDWIRRPKLGRTLETISREGVDSFYNGPMAKSIVAVNRKHGGLFTEDDMRSYKVEIKEPVSVQYGNMTVTSVPAPAGGASVLSILKIMEGYDFEDGVNLTMHRLNEAFRFAYGGRAVMGDPLYVARMNELQKEIMTEEYAKSVRKNTSDEHTLPWKDYTPSGFETQDSHGTSHIVTSDASGLTISLTTTVNFYFGSGNICPDTGVILNDQMADFSTPIPAPPFFHAPAPANYAQAGKRPLSAISPTIVILPGRLNNGISSYDTSQKVTPPLFTLGAAGGPRIVTLVATLLLLLLPPYMPHPNLPSSVSSNTPPTMKQALALPRLHDNLTPNQTSLELGQADIGVEGFDNATAAFLASRGHIIDWTEPHASAAQMLGWQCDLLEDGEEDCGFAAASDMRHKLGSARVR